MKIRSVVTGVILLMMLMLPSMVHAATVDIVISPDILNLASEGKWVTAYISPPGDCQTDAIDRAALAITSLLLNGTDEVSVYIPAAVEPWDTGDYDGDGAPELMVKFPRDELQQGIGVPGFVAVTIEGQCGTILLSGVDMIRAIGEREVHAEVTLPDGVGPAAVTISSPTGEAHLSKKGVLTLSGLPTRPFMVSMAVGDMPVAFSFFDPNADANTVSCRETAVSIVMLNTLLVAVPSPILAEALEMVRSLPEVQAYGDVLCEELSQSPDALVTEPSEAAAAVLAAAVKAVYDTLKAMAEPYAQNAQ